MLHEDVCNFYRFETGVRIQIFMDRQDIGWGQQWESVIANGINTTVFMMPIITPSYFQSAACRDELIRFNSLCGQRGLTELILPIVFSGLNQISTESDDPVAQIVAGAQFRNFCDVWPAERGSEPWNLAVRELVTELIDAELRAEVQLADFAQRQAGKPASDGDSEDGDAEDSTPGIVDLLAEVDAAIDEIQPSLSDAVAKFEIFGDAITQTPFASGQSPTDPRGFQRDIVVAANRFRDPAAEFEESASTALAKVRQVDQIMTPLRAQLSKLHDPSYSAQFHQSVAPLRSVEEVAGQMEMILNQMRDLELLSSVLRKELRPARRGITFIRDAANLVTAWAI